MAIWLTFTEDFILWRILQSKFGYLSIDKVLWNRPQWHNWCVNWMRQHKENQNQFFSRKLQSWIYFEFFLTGAPPNWSVTASGRSTPFSSRTSAWTMAATSRSRPPTGSERPRSLDLWPSSPRSRASPSPLRVWQQNLDALKALRYRLNKYF